MKKILRHKKNGNYLQTDGTWGEIESALYFDHTELVLQYLRKSPHVTDVEIVFKIGNRAYDANAVRRVRLPILDEDV
jgi:hypothetical protein